MYEKTKYDGDHVRGSKLVAKFNENIDEYNKKLREYKKTVETLMKDPPSKSENWNITDIEILPNRRGDLLRFRFIVDRITKGNDPRLELINLITKDIKSIGKVICENKIMQSVIYSVNKLGGISTDGSGYTPIADGVILFENDIEKLKNKDFSSIIKLLKPTSTRYTFNDETGGANRRRDGVDIDLYASHLLSVQTYDIVDNPTNDFLRYFKYFYKKQDPLKEQINAEFTMSELQKQANQKDTKKNLTVIIESDNQIRIYDEKEKRGGNYEVFENNTIKLRSGYSMFNENGLDDLVLELTSEEIDNIFDKKKLPERFLTKKSEAEKARTIIELTEFFKNNKFQERAGNSYIKEIKSINYNGISFCVVSDGTGIIDIEHAIELMKTGKTQRYSEFYIYKV